MPGPSAAARSSLVDMTWNATPLNSALKRAFLASVKAAERVASARNPAPSRIKVSSYVDFTRNIGFVRGRGGLAHIFEGGRAGGYPIQPGLKSTTAKGGSVKAGKGSNIAIKFVRGDGGFYRGPGFLGGPMAARPYIAPAAAWWANGGFHSYAGAALGGLR